MPKFYFDLIDDKTVFDSKGVSLKDLKAAREYAVTFARELMATKPELCGESWSKWSVQICNGKMERVLTIRFGESASAGGLELLAAEDVACSRVASIAGGPSGGHRASSARIL